MDRVVFACRHNAGRSQMAAAFFNNMADRSKAEGISAGTAPAAHVHSRVVIVMNEIGIDLAGATPRLLTQELAAGASLLVTMGCGEECPFVPGVPIEDWQIEDPIDQSLERVREIRAEIRRRVAELLESRGWARSKIPRRVSLKRAKPS